MCGIRTETPWESRPHYEGPVEKNVEGCSPGPRGPLRPGLRLGALAPTPSRCPSLRFGTFAVCALGRGVLASGHSGHVPRPSGPCCGRRCAPVARQRLPPVWRPAGRPLAVLRPSPGCCGLPAGVVALAPCAGRCARLRAAWAPLPLPCGPLRVRAPPARGLCRPGGRPLRPAPGRGGWGLRAAARADFWKNGITYRQKGGEP